MESQTKILIIYTGGTIGMVKDAKTGVLKPFQFENLMKMIPSLAMLNYQIDSHCFDPLIDSSNMDPVYWAGLVDIIEKKYEGYDGFVVLHGSDTMSYTASALSFMLQNLNKPVIFTGSQLPLGMVRSDGRENLVTAIEIAAATEDETPLVPEVCIYFENQLFRGNRTHKFNAENFEAFRSPNYPVLADAGVYIKYNRNAIHKPNFKKLKANKKLDTNIAILKLFPGISEKVVSSILHIPDLKAVIMESYGAGNAPDSDWFVNLIADAIEKGIIVLNLSQCQGGSVMMGKYETSIKLLDIGVVGAYDMTTEAAVAKLMYLLGNSSDKREIEKKLQKPIAGELTITN
ncbi:MAG: asparaginase [Chlorobi bacterium]|nr:asparaginase [Chlorobiota bacterium]